ncbi:UDP-glucose 4-epimerase GalE [Carboxylicivirga sp. N1Y90]|uniref:UDP-glucose 4-epimerase GalE n=1 Tax=Carboxylicivirga fragile TaxID=3417571 RepID=UPI003D3550AF|nr:UDP-glucose 4-epimerase GalE [Marinilabiliaceae bacterium N1Y90]
MSKKILVTGGTGYIGSHTVVELIQEGFEVVIIDDLSNSQVEVVDRIADITGVKPGFEQFNLCDEGLLSDFFQRHNDIVGVIHFAAFKAVGESVTKPLKYYRNNLVSLMNVLESLDHLSLKNVVFSSSCTVYGQPDNLPVTENAPLKPAESPYGNTKKVCEEILLDACSADIDLNVISLRYFNPVGAHESALIGELPKGKPNNLMPFITQTGAGILPELSVFGDDYDTEDGTAIRDYVHVVDLAKAHIAAVKHLLNISSDNNYQHYNIGTGNGYSVLDLIKSFERHTGQKLPYKIVGRRAGDIEKIYAGTALANERLNWSAKLELDEMVSSAWKWQKTLKN